MHDFEYIKLYRDKLSKNPNDIEALLELSCLYLDDCSWPNESVDMLEHVMWLDPSNIEAYFWLAKTYIHCVIDDEKAKQVLEKALKIDPNRADCNYLFAGFVENPEKSKFYIKKVIKAEPTWIFPRNALAYYLIDKGKFDKAEQMAKETLEIWEKMEFPPQTKPTERYYEQCVRGRKKSAIISIDTLFEDIKEARQKHKELIENTGRMKKLNTVIMENPTDKKNIKEKWFLCTYKVDKAEDAIKMLEKALKTEPDNVDYLYWLAQTFYKQKKNDKTKKALLKALKIDPSRADCHCLISKTATDFHSEYDDDPLLNSIRKHNSNVTIAHLKTAVKLEPTWILPHIDLIKYYFAHNVSHLNLDKILKEIYLTFDMAKRLCAPKTKDIIEKYHETFVTGRALNKNEIQGKLQGFFIKVNQERRRLYQGLCLHGHFLGLIFSVEPKCEELLNQTREKYFEHVEKLDKEIKNNPNNLEIKIERAFLCFATIPGKGFFKEEIMSDLRMAVEKQPNNAKYLFALAYELYAVYSDWAEINDPEILEAKKLVEKALKIEPERADCLTLMAEILRTLGEDLGKTIALLKQAIKLEPTWITPRIKLSYYLIESGKIDSAKAVAKEALATFEKLKFPNPKTTTEQYYEEVITGRTPLRLRSFLPLSELIKDQRES